MQSEQIDKLAIALSKAQAVMEAAAKNKKNPHYNSMYADLASIIEAVRKPLTDNGLAFTQTIQAIEPGLFLETTLLHTSGQWVRSQYPLLQGTAQQTGSSLTYARRYSLSSIAGIAADEDDDGNLATKANGSQKAKPLQPLPGGAKTPHIKQQALPTEDNLIAEHDAPDAVKPHQLSLQQLPNKAGPNWRIFGDDLMKAVRDAETKSDVFEWLDKNKASLAEMEKAMPKMHKSLTEKIDAIVNEPT